jgi:hypothetical protein
MSAQSRTCQHLCASGQTYYFFVSLHGLPLQAIIFFNEFGSLKIVVEDVNGPIKADFLNKTYRKEKSESVTGTAEVSAFVKDHVESRQCYVLSWPF